MNSKELQKARGELDMTQQELADTLGIQRNTVTRYEIGLLDIPKTVHLAMMYLLSDHLGKLSKEQVEKRGAEVKTKGKK